MASKDATETVSADGAGIARAADILRAGGLVAVPTETVYGLAARADSPEAVARIYTAKGRPDSNPLIVHVRDADQARQYGELTAEAQALAEAHWPGPLTLVVPRNFAGKLADAVAAGLKTIALRAPAHPAMRALLEACDFPLAAPSANRSGFISPTSAVHVAQSLDGRIDLVLDGGPDACGMGVESTIIAVRPDGSLEVLRPGPIDLGRLAGEAASGTGPEAIEAPGQLASHYAPGKPMRLCARNAVGGEFLIGFGDVEGAISLSPGGSLEEAAARLYACLHEAALSPEPRIAVAPVPEEGIGKAINDRLRRAAA